VCTIAVTKNEEAPIGGEVKRNLHSLQERSAFLSDNLLFKLARRPIRTLSMSTSHPTAETETVLYRTGNFERPSSLCCRPLSVASVGRNSDRGVVNDITPLPAGVVDQLGRSQMRARTVSVNYVSRADNHDVVGADGYGADVILVVPMENRNSRMALFPSSLPSYALASIDGYPAITRPLKMPHRAS
jgi:hypothetical protein